MLNSENEGNQDHSGMKSQDPLYLAHENSAQSDPVTQQFIVKSQGNCLMTYSVRC